jgi:triacylglycerol lipase
VRGPPGSTRMPTLSPKAIPRVTEVRDLFRLGPCVEPIDRAGVADFLDRESRRFAYRFFRDCEVAPFIQTTDRFQAINAWYLSDAALLAYADAKIEPDTEASSEQAASIVTGQITPSIRRLFEAVWAADGLPAGAALTVHTIVRNSPVVGVPDPVQCYVADDGNVGIVAFRGTVPSSLPNWLTDCEIKMVNADASATDVLVHEGFWSAATVLMEDFGRLPGLRRYLRGRLEQKPGLRLWFTGHSFGAALATLSAYRIGSVQSLHTYGSPRVGNVHFANAFSRSGITHYRIVHRHDIVPYVPVPLPLLEYEHVGDLKYIEYTDESSAGSGAVPRRDEAPQEGPVEKPAASKVRGTWEHLCEMTAHLRVGRIGGWLDHITDHALICYSTVLWNEFVKEHAQSASGSRAAP